MGSRYLSKTALFGPKTVSLRCHRFVTALFGPEKCLEKQLRLGPGAQPGAAWCRPGAALVRAWCRPGAALVRAWCGPGAALRGPGCGPGCGPGAGLVRAWLRAWRGPGAPLVRRWCGPGADLRRIAPVNPVAGAGLLHSILSPQQDCPGALPAALAWSRLCLSTAL